MFELLVAYKYLVPRWRQLSVSIISMISILVIALVVWLILVFFSVSNGLEKIWVGKLITLTAPVRMMPTEAYYQSYYYQVDSISEAAGYNSKSIQEKRESAITDPYHPDIDEEIPADWLAADRNSEGALKDLVKEAFAAVASLKDVPGITAQPYEMTYGNLRLRLLRPQAGSIGVNQSYLTQGVYLGSFDRDHPTLQNTLLPVSGSDISNLIASLSLSSEGIQEEAPEDLKHVDQKEFQSRLKAVLENATVTQLKTPNMGWMLPKALYPKSGSLKVGVVMRNGRIGRVIIPQEARSLSQLFERFAASDEIAQEGTLEFPQLTLTMRDQKNTQTLPRVPLLVEGGVEIAALWHPSPSVKSLSDLQFDVVFSLQGVKFEGLVRLGQLEIDHVDLLSGVPQTAPLWIHRDEASWVLPKDPKIGEGILLPKNFRDSGVRIGDQGFLAYHTPTASAMQEQRIPIFVSGFFDHGIMPMGGKFVFISPEMTSLIRSVYDAQDQTASTGINVRFDKLSQAEAVKEGLQRELAKRGIDSYWKVETYQEYEFTKDLIQQLHSEKNLFTLISVVIIIVACSNIISMLIILVNDKKLEIGILRAMGATSKSIATIFGLCGLIMGALGSLIGIGFAIFTLRHLHVLLDLIGKVQGHEVFTAAYFGNVLPNELSYEALTFVLIATACISLLAGIVPAVKASLLRPSAVLRSE